MHFFLYQFEMFTNISKNTQHIVKRNKPVSQKKKSLNGTDKTF